MRRVYHYIPPFLRNAHLFWGFNMKLLAPQITTSLRVQSLGFSTSAHSNYVMKTVMAHNLSIHDFAVTGWILKIHQWDPQHANSFISSDEQ